MAWNVGKGTNILIGVDPIVGSNKGFSLPEDLRSYLQDLNIITLDQAQNTLHDAQNYWYTAEDLNLGGIYSVLWKDYIAGLNGAGVRLTKADDELVWGYSKKMGSLSAKNAYDCIVSASTGPISKTIDGILWNKSLPKKITCFIWLAVRDKILTWENLQKRGKSGPGICLLFKAENETVGHLFTQCVVWNSVAAQVCDHFSLHSFNKQLSLEDMLLEWMGKLGKNSDHIFFRFI